MSTEQTEWKPSQKQLDTNFGSKVVRCGTKGKRWKLKPKPESPLEQAITLQRAIFDKAKEGLDNLDVLSVTVPLWDRIENQRQALAGHGKPKPVDASNEPRRNNAQSVPTIKPD